MGRVHSAFSRDRTPTSCCSTAKRLAKPFQSPSPSAWIRACSWPLPFRFGVDELAMAGAIRAKPFEVVACKTVPLQVSADAELVLEGFLRPDEKQEEGPFGEFTGHYGGLKMPRPTIHLTALTRRKNPILHLAYQGAPPHETDVLTAVGKESEILRNISLAGVKA